MELCRNLPSDNARLEIVRQNGEFSPFKVFRILKILVLYQDVILFHLEIPVPEQYEPKTAIKSMQNSEK